MILNLKAGKLHRRLRLPADTKIPTTELQKFIGKKSGTTVTIHVPYTGKRKQYLGKTFIREYTVPASKPSLGIKNPYLIFMEEVRLAITMRSWKH